MCVFGRHGRRIGHFLDGDADADAKMRIGFGFRCDLLAKANKNTSPSDLVTLQVIGIFLKDLYNLNSAKSSSLSHE